MCENPAKSEQIVENCSKSQQILQISHNLCISFQIAGNPKDSQPILVESRKSLWNLRAPHDPLQVLGYCLHARVEHSRPFRNISVCNNPWPIIRPAVGSRLRHTSNLQEACGHKRMCPVSFGFAEKGISGKSAGTLTGQSMAVQLLRPSWNPGSRATGPLGAQSVCVWCVVASLAF